MFKSKASGKQYPEGTKPVKVIVEYREVTYINSYGKVSKGMEPVRELLIGPDEQDLVKEANIQKVDKIVQMKRETNAFEQKTRY